MLIVQSSPSYAADSKWKFWQRDKNNNNGGVHNIWNRNKNNENQSPQSMPSEDSLWEKVQPETKNLQAEKNAATSDIQFGTVEIEGNNLISTEEILENVKIRPGDPYSVDAVQQNMKSIYEMGYFTDKMRAVPVKVDDKTIKLKIIVQENIPITDFTITGNDSIATGDLLQILGEWRFTSLPFW